MTVGDPMKWPHLFFLALFAPKVSATNVPDLLNYSMSERPISEKIIQAYKMFFDTAEFIFMSRPPYYSLLLEGTKCQGPLEEVENLLPLPPGYYWQSLYPEIIWCFYNLHKAEITEYSLSGQKPNIPAISLWRICKTFPGGLSAVFFWTPIGFKNTTVLDSFFSNNIMAQTPMNMAGKSNSSLIYDVLEVFSRYDEQTPFLKAGAPNFLIADSKYKLTGDVKSIFKLVLPHGLSFFRRKSLEMNGKLIEMTFRRRKGKLLSGDPKVQIWLYEGPHQKDPVLWTRRGLSDLNEVNQFLNHTNKNLPAPPKKIRVVQQDVLDTLPPMPVAIPDEQNPFDFLEVL